MVIGLPLGSPLILGVLWRIGLGVFVCSFVFSSEFNKKQRKKNQCSINVQVLTEQNVCPWKKSPRKHIGGLRDEEIVNLVSNRVLIVTDSCLGLEP